MYALSEALTGPERRCHEKGVGLMRAPTTSQLRRKATFSGGAGADVGTTSYIRAQPKLECARRADCILVVGDDRASVEVATPSAERRRQPRPSAATARRVVIIETSSGPWPAGEGS